MNNFTLSLFLLLAWWQLNAQETPVIDSVKVKIKTSVSDQQRLGYLNDLAWEYSLINFDSAKKYTHKAIQLAEEVGDLYWKAVSYEMNAILYEISGEQEEAIKLYLDVIALREKLGGEGIENTYNNVAILFRNQNNHQKALEYFGESYRIELQKNNKKGVVASLINMAVSLKDLGLNDSAFVQTKKARAMALENNDDEYVVYASVNIAKYYYDEGKGDSVLYYNRNVTDKARELQMYGPLATILQLNADVYIERQQYEKALEHLREAEIHASRVNVKEMLRNNYASKARAYAGLRAFDLAYDNLWKYIQVNDSIINNHTIEVLNDLEKKYETAKKDQNIAQLNEINARNELDAQRQANVTQIAVFSAVFVVLLALLVVFTLRQKLKSQRLLAKKNEEIKAANFQKKLGELELKALRSQMNPHFIFNCINSINTMILNGERENASRYLNKFSKLIRLTLENSEHTSITLEDELSMLETYIQLEAIRFQEKIRYEISIDPAIDQSSILLPSMVLQPFVENAIWHGLMHKEGTGRLKIIFTEEENDLKCTIEDDGVGRERASKLTGSLPEKSKSMGIKITEERLKLIGKNPINDRVQIVDLKDAAEKPIGTRVNISIPIY